MIRMYCLHYRCRRLLPCVASVLLFILIVAVVTFYKPTINKEHSRPMLSLFFDASHRNIQDDESNPRYTNGLPHLFANQSEQSYFRISRDEQHVQKVCQTTCTKIVFIKTHKTASSTIASIFLRFGYLHNLLFAFPKGRSSFPDTGTFSRESVLPIPKGLSSTKRHYDILANHARLDRQGMETLIPNARFITVLREPTAQLESAFGYFEMAKGMGIDTDSNPLETFMNKPEYFYKTRSYKMKSRSRNGQLYDLGLAPDMFDNDFAVRRKIESLNQELDLVLLTEYIDESLILMKRILCWDFNDILYIPMGIRSQTHRFPVSTELRNKIRVWNKADVALYEHFNRTFWKNVKKYGSEFNADLLQFQELKKQVLNRCVDDGKLNRQDIREDKYVLNLREDGDFCRNLLRHVDEYTGLLKSILKLGQLQ